MKKWLFNPFIYIAGAKALVIGWAVMLLTAFISYYSRSHFDGVIDMHAGRVTPAAVYYAEILVDWAFAVLIFYPAGLIFSKSSIRLIDVAGTMALARWVMLFTALISFGVHAPAATESVNEIVKSITPVTIMLGLLSLACIAWMIALMYNAFRVSCNIKGSKATIVFVAALLIAELAAHFTLHHLYKYLNWNL